MNGITSNDKPSSTQSPHSPSSSSNSGTSPSACAACKYQRRRCYRDCILAPHFPADKPKQFLNAHRLFGVSNILKIIKNVEPEKRRDAMTCIIYQSNMRAQDPVGGCYRVMLDLKHQIDVLSAELNFVKSKIAYYRAKLPAESPGNIASSEEANYIPTTAADLYANMAAMQHQQYYYPYKAQEGQESDQNGHITNGIEFDMKSNALENEGSEMGMLNLQQGVDGEGNVKPLIDILELRHAFEDDGDSKDVTAVSTITALHSSSRTDEQNTSEHEQENELKNAASLFSLTNCDTPTP